MTITRTLLLTDVVDSTKLSEELGDAAMAELWAKHDRVARDLLPLHDGREIDKTDGFLMLFTEATDAVAYAVAYHRALRELGIAARAGLHVGPVILTENAPADVARGAKPLEVDGIAKPTAARVMSVASGGQTLLTPSAVEALGDTELRLESHGHWRMKGVAEPLELFEIGDADAPFTPPPDAGKVYRVVQQGALWLPVREVKHSLPAERDAFVGRSQDLQELDRLLRESRLVSVLGIGGTGKTRLVTRHGWTWLGDYPGGVWFCDLSEARSVEGIVFAVARAFDVPLGAVDPVVQLGHAIAGRGPCLVILDNFEQVARFAPDTLGTWLDRASEARFVVTTRELLGLPGETTLPLAPLVTEESLDLFVTRARQAKPSFDPTDTASIEALVELLDHLPLAIELAAARVRVMPPKTLLERMSQRFKLLASRAGRHTRQATLRGALDWSWDLLDPDEQSALAQLSVFEGGFSLEAAEAVLELEELWGMDAVQALVDKSLVRKVSDERFDLLVSVQEYAGERLRQSAARTETESRHGAFFAEFDAPERLEHRYPHGEPAPRELRIPELRVQELDNLVAACRRATQRSDTDIAVRCLEASWAVLARRGPPGLGLDLGKAVCGLALSTEERCRAGETTGLALEQVGRTEDACAQYETVLVAARDLGDRQREGRALNHLGRIHRHRGELEEAHRRHAEALAIHREDGDIASTGAVLTDLGWLLQIEGRYDEAHAHVEEARIIHRQIGDVRGEATAIGYLGSVAGSQGRLDDARAHYQECLALHHGSGDRHSEGVVIGNLGTIELEQGRIDKAMAHYAKALELYREVGDRRAEGLILGNLGNAHGIAGQLEDARRFFEAAIAIHREAEDRATQGRVLGNLGYLLLLQGKLVEAQAQLEEALALTREAGNFPMSGSILGFLGTLHLAEGRMAEARSALSEGEAVLRELGDRLGLAELLCDRCRLEVEEAQPARARETLEEAKAIAASLGAGPDSPLGQQLAKARSALEDA